MINQFRQNYPQGSIISELITIDHGQYVVRVIIKVEGNTLATGLAGASTVEGAEDKARDRALSLLSLQQTNHSSVTIMPKSQPPEPRKVAKPEYPNLSLVPPPLVTEPSLILQQPPLDKPVDKPAPVLSTPSELTVDSVDNSGGELVSDKIAQINIQMNRLGWTKEQGRDYLLKTYGKKSRHLLCDEELAEFLDYLQMQTDS